MRDPSTVMAPGHWADGLAMPYARSASVVFEHRGAMDHARMERLLEMAEAHSVEAKVGVAARKRLFNVLVEGLENIRTHAPEDLRGTAFAQLLFLEPVWDLLDSADHRFGLKTLWGSM